MKYSKTVILALLTGLLAACGGSGSSNGDESASKTTKNKLIILNQMTPTGYVKDGVALSRIIGSNSVGDIDQEFIFEEPIEFNRSGTVYIPDNKCDVYWDLSPKSNELLNIIPNSGVQFFVGCGQTLSCKAETIVAAGFIFGNLSCQ